MELYSRVVTLPIRYNSCRNDLRRRFCMNTLIVKKDMCAESRQDFFLAYSAKEERLVNTYAPGTECFDCSLMCRCIPRCYKRGSNRRSILICNHCLNMCKGQEEIGKRTFLQRNICLFPFTLHKSIHAFVLINTFGFRIKQHGIPIKSDADLL